MQFGNNILKPEDRPAMKSVFAWHNMDKDYLFSSLFLWAKARCN